MSRIQWHYKLIYLVTLLLVACILPLSCIVHCHVHDQVPSATPNLFVCHPFSTIDNDSPHHLHAQSVALRATHEVAMPLTLLMAVVVVGSSLLARQTWYSEWLSLPHTPPPRFKPI